jgi:hypothetical protein
MLQKSTLYEHSPREASDCFSLFVKCIIKCHLDNDEYSFARGLRKAERYIKAWLAEITITREPLVAEAMRKLMTALNRDLGEWSLKLMDLCAPLLNDYPFDPEKYNKRNYTGLPQAERMKWTQLRAVTATEGFLTQRLQGQGRRQCSPTTTNKEGEDGSSGTDAWRIREAATTSTPDAGTDTAAAAGQVLQARRSPQGQHRQPGTDHDAAVHQGGLRLHPLTVWSSSQGSERAAKWVP